MIQRGYLNSQPALETNYPVYLMEYPEDNSDTNGFKNHPFDKYRHIKKKTKK